MSMSWRPKEMTKSFTKAIQSFFCGVGGMWVTCRRPLLMKSSAVSA